MKTHIIYITSDIIEDHITFFYTKFERFNNDQLSIDIDYDGLKAHKWYNIKTATRSGQGWVMTLEECI